MTLDEQYLALLDRVLSEGEYRENRTGNGTYSIWGAELRHDMRDGFPLLTTRRVPYKSELVELEGFIKGITSKKWYQERNCKFWDPFCNPQIVPYRNDDLTKAAMEHEDDLGAIYGAQWRNFTDYREINPKRGIDQLMILVEKIRSKYYDRRWIVTAWNPLAQQCQALPPCHYEFSVHLSPCETYLDLIYNQRSVDLPLGNALPKYGALLTLLAKEGNVIPRMLIARYEDTHIYKDQIPTVHSHLKRFPRSSLPSAYLNDWKWEGIFKWSAEDLIIENYRHSGVLKYPHMAV